MSLNAEWRARVEAWRRELVNHFYRELGSMPLSGFITLDSLSPAAALRRRFVPTPPGTRWGAKWEYGWFKGTVTLPAEAAGRRIVAQDVSLRRGSRRVDFHTTVDWQESHKLLKVAFPVDIHANEALHEIQFGHLRRPNHKSRPFDALRFEVVNHKWTALMEECRGFAVLNDCKYGVNVLGNTIALTLLKSALGPDMTADKGVQEFSYAFLVWNGSFADSPVVREGYELNCSVKVVSGGAGHRTLFSVDAPNIIIETVKPAEDGSNDIIVRMYESTRTATRCTLSTSLPVIGVQQTDMLENAERELEWSADGIPLDFRAFEIKTLRLRTKPR